MAKKKKPGPISRLDYPSTGHVGPGATVRGGGQHRVLKPKKKKA